MGITARLYDMNKPEGNHFMQVGDKFEMSKIPAKNMIFPSNGMKFRSISTYFYDIKHRMLSERMSETRLFRLDDDRNARKDMPYLLIAYLNDKELINSKVRLIDFNVTIEILSDPQEYDFIEYLDKSYFLHFVDQVNDHFDAVIIEKSKNAFYKNGMP